MSKEQVTKALQDAIQGLTYPSESDEPFQVVYWKGNKQPLTPQKMLELAGEKTASPVKVQSLEEFFKPLLQSEEWHGAEEKSQIKKFRALQDTLKKQLLNPQAYRIGKVKIAIYLAGLTPEGDLAGVKTAAVET